MPLFCEHFARLGRMMIGIVAVLSLAGFVLPTSAAFALTITDVTGRTVELKAPAKRILLDPYSIFPGLSLLRHDAADLIVGIGALPQGDLFDADEALKDKPRLGWIVSQTFSVEKAIALEPDLLIATKAAAGKQKPLEDAFAKAGIPIIYIDFAENPAENTISSIEIIGKVIGESERAEQYVRFYREHMNRITDRLKASKPARTKMLITPRASGWPCCFTMTRGGVASYFGDLGLENIAEGMGSGGNVQLSLEYVIEKNPDVWIATDVLAGAQSVFGQPRSLERAHAELEKLSREPGLSETAAMRQGRLHLIDVTLSRSPLNILFLENVAKWAHPELFAEVDPQATLDEINRRFSAKPLVGPFWASKEMVPQGAQ
jgi:iron complex transport system substrate-binding protein